MCFVWISEQTAIISLYSINWLVCVTETECVYCAVRTGYLCIIEANFTLWRADNSAHPILSRNFPINDHSYELRYVPETYLHTHTHTHIQCANRRWKGLNLRGWVQPRAELVQRAGRSAAELYTQKAQHTTEGNIVHVQAAHIYSTSSVQLHAFLTSLYMTVSDQLHVPDAIIGRKAQQAGWTPELGCRACWRQSRPFPSLAYSHSARIH